MTTPDFSFDGRFQKFQKSPKHLRTVTQGIQQTAELKRAIEVALVRYSRRGADWAPKLFYDWQIFVGKEWFGKVGYLKSRLLWEQIFVAKKWVGLVGYLESRWTKTVFLRCWSCGCFVNDLKVLTTVPRSSKGPLARSRFWLKFCC